MPRRLKYVTVTMMGFFLFAGIAYACPGTTLVHDEPINVSNTMAGHDMDQNDGCVDNNVNKCQSVRDQMLSATVSLEAPTGCQRLSEEPQALLAVTSVPRLLSGASPPLTQAFHPVYKLPLSFSYLVLRL